MLWESEREREIEREKDKNRMTRMKNSKFGLVFFGFDEDLWFRNESKPMEQIQMEWLSQNNKDNQCTRKI